MSEKQSVLNRQERRLLRKKLKGQPVAKQWATVQRLAVELAYPLNEAELKLSDEILSHLVDVQWFHGGRGGRSLGDVLVPAIEAVHFARGCAPSTLTKVIPAVYFTTNFDLAQKYAEAVLHTAGQVYQVKPLGRVEADSNDLRAVTLLSEIRPIREPNGQLLPWLAQMAFCAPQAKVIGFY